MKLPKKTHPSIGLGWALPPPSPTNLPSGANAPEHLHSRLGSRLWLSIHTSAPQTKSTASYPPTLFVTFSPSRPPSLVSLFHLASPALSCRSTSLCGIRAYSTNNTTTFSQTLVWLAAQPSQVPRMPALVPRYYYDDDEYVPDYPCACFTATATATATTATLFPSLYGQRPRLCCALPYSSPYLTTCNCDTVYITQN